MSAKQPSVMSRIEGDAVAIRSGSEGPPLTGIGRSRGGKAQLDSLTEEKKATPVQQCSNRGCGGLPVPGSAWIRRCATSRHHTHHYVTLFLTQKNSHGN